MLHTHGSFEGIRNTQKPSFYRTPGLDPCSRKSNKQGKKQKPAQVRPMLQNWNKGQLCLGVEENHNYFLRRYNMTKRKF
jgi:hypothetical protein